MWNIIYKIYPPFLRILEKLKIHNYRQPYLIQTDKDLDILKFEKYLSTEGFEKAILAWKDPGEILSMRKVDIKIFQYHIRVFSDGEIRGHYEYSSEGNPIGHVREKVFEERAAFFKNLMNKFIQS